MCDNAKEPAGTDTYQRVGRPVEEVRRIPAGTRVQIAGRPFELMEPVVVSGHPDNFVRAAVEQVFPQPDLNEDRPLSPIGRNSRFA